MNQRALHAPEGRLASLEVPRSVAAIPRRRELSLKQTFFDRSEAGQALAELLSKRNDLVDPVVLALPRGGVPVGFEVARALECPLDVLLVRKLGLPDQPELAMGAIASGGVRVMNPEVVTGAWVSEHEIRRVIEEETRELERRELAYRGDRPPAEVRGRTVILVDDGVATGSSILAAIRALRVREPAAVIVAVPVAPRGTTTRLASEADAVVCAATPEPFYAISLAYGSFPQVSDEEVRALLAEAAAGPGPGVAAEHSDAEGEAN